MSLAYYTVVYRVEGDNAAHRAWWESIRPLFMTDSEPVSVSIISQANEVVRLDCIEHIVAGHDSASDKLEAIEVMLLHPDPARWWIENAEPPAGAEPDVNSRPVVG
jgi:hypothetical protein